MLKVGGSWHLFKTLKVGGGCKPNPGTMARKRPHNLMTGTLANRGLNNPISLKERRTLDHALHEAAESDKGGPSSSTTTVD